MSGKRRKHCTQLTTGKKPRKRVLESSCTIESESDCGPQNEEINCDEASRQISTGTQVTPKKTSTVSLQYSNVIPKPNGSTGHREITTCGSQTCETPIPNCEDLPKSFQKLISDGTLNVMCNILSNYSQLKDFENLLRSIADGTIQPTNISWLLNIHLGRLTSVTSTTQMRWNEEIVEFFSIIYLLFGASAINVLRGPMHFSDIIMDNVCRGKFDPKTAKINLPIPSITTLRSFSTGYPKEIPVGLIEHTLSVASAVAKEKNTQYILSFDGKLVARGFKGDSSGDIDLWGIEKPISVSSAITLLKHNIDTCRLLKKEVNNGNISRHICHLKSLLNQLTRRIHTLRQRIEGEHFLRLKLTKMSQSQTLDSRQQYSYKMQLSFLNEHSARCDTNIGRALHINHKLLKTLSACMKNSDVFCDSKIVDFGQQNNSYFLFSCERNSQFFDLNSPENTDLVKQRSDVWFQMRKNAKVTGSTLFNALGLSTLANLKSHHYKFVRRRPPPDFPDDVKQRLKYGQDNEKHGIANIVGAFLPTFKSSCFSYVEVGPTFLTVYGEENFMEVSPDGVLHCLNGETCENRTTLDKHNIIPVEVKCVYPDSSKPLQPHYNLPLQYIPQCLSQMAAYSSPDLWFVSYTENSCTLFILRFHKALWDKMMKIAHELHGGDKPKVPTKLHKETNSLRLMLHSYTKTHCTLLAEITSFHGVETALREGEIISPYNACDMRPVVNLDIENIQQLSHGIGFEAKTLFEDIHNTLRQEAQEVLVFMLSDHNRHHEEFIQYSLPLGYTMKGKTLKNAELRFLVNHCRNRLNELEIPILCEVYNGQWQNLCMTSESGEPLTQLRLIKPTWQRVQKFSKEKCIQELCLTSKLKVTDLEIIATEKRLEKGTRNCYNITIEKNNSDGFSVTSRGGEYFSEPAIRHIKTVNHDTYPQLWETSDGGPTELDEDKLKGRKKKLVGLRESEKNLVHLLNSEVVTALEEELGEEGVEMSENILEETDNSEQLLRMALRHSDISLLNEILEDLREHNPKKWLDITTEDLYPRILTSATELNRKCTIADLNLIGKVLEHKTGRRFFNSGEKKAWNINIITKAFGGENFLEIPLRRDCTKKRPKSLQFLVSKNY